MSMTQPRQENRAVFGAGCFWGIESTYMELAGVTSTAVGYMGGQTLSPTYHDVCSGRTGHVEVVQLTFDLDRISYKELIDVFWKTHDPTQVNRQGPDIGTQYRSVIFYYTDEQKTIAEECLRDHQKHLSVPIATGIEMCRDFWRAEEYHQQYFQKKGISGGCRIG